MAILVTKVSDELRERYEFARSRIHRETILLYAALTLIVILGFLIRLSTYFNWAPLLGGGGDAWSQLKAAEYINQHGLLSYLSYIDNTTWYPYGRNWGATQYIGIPLMGVVFYHLFNLLGFNVPFEVACFLSPGIVGGLSVFAIYFLGKEIANKKIGLMSALLLSINPGHIQRSYAGFFGNESLGDLLIILVLYFYLRSLRKGSFLDAIWAGIGLGILADTWGGSTYITQLLALYAIVMILTKRYSHRLFTSYSLTTIVSTILTVVVPRSGTGFFLTINSIIPLGVISLMMLFELYRYNKSTINTFISGRILELIGYTLFVLGIIFFILDLFYPIIPTFQTKFVTVLLPFLRSNNSILNSVAENVIVTWGAIFQNTFIIVFLIPIGLVYCYQNPTERNIFLLLFSFTGVYMAATMARLILVLAPSSVIMGAKAIDETLIPYAQIFQEKFFLSKRKKNVSVSIGNEHVSVTFILFFALIVLQIFQGINTAQGILGPSDVSLQFQLTNGQLATYGDWQQVSQWFVANTNPSNTVIAAWWDYGYWINVFTNRTIIDDPATINTTQIANIGALMMEPPNIALEIAKYYDINYILVLTAGGLVNQGFDNDLGKTQWMVQISAQSSNLAPALDAPIVVSNYFQTDSLGNFIAFNKAFYESTIWGLMTQGFDATAYSQLTQYQLIKNSNQAYVHQGFDPKYSMYLNIFKPAYTTHNNWIRVWKIDWNAAARLTGV